MIAHFNQFPNYMWVVAGTPGRHRRDLRKLALLPSHVARDIRRKMSSRARLGKPAPFYVINLPQPLTARERKYLKLVLNNPSLMDMVMRP